MTMKGTIAIVAILVLLLVTVTATGAAWVSLHSVFINGNNQNDFEIISDSAQCTDGTILIEIMNSKEKSLTNSDFHPIDIRKTDNTYEVKCHSECLRLNQPLQKGQIGIFLEWGCPNNQQLGCSAGTYIISFRTEHQIEEILVKC